MLVSLGQFSVGGFSLGASKARAVGWGHNTKNVHETCTVAFCHVLWHNVRMRTACTRRLPSNTAGLGRAAPQRRLRSIHCHLPRPDEDQEPMVTMQGRDKLANQAGDNGAPSALKPMLFNVGSAAGHKNRSVPFAMPKPKKGNILHLLVFGGESVFPTGRNSNFQSRV